MNRSFCCCWESCQGAHILWMTREEKSLRDIIINNRTCISWLLLRQKRFINKKKSHISKGKSWRILYWYQRPDINGVEGFYIDKEPIHGNVLRHIHGQMHEISWSPRLQETKRANAMRWPNHSIPIISDHQGALAAGKYHTWHKTPPHQGARKVEPIVDVSNTDNQKQIRRRLGFGPLKGRW